MSLKLSAAAKRANEVRRTEGIEAALKALGYALDYAKNEDAFSARIRIEEAISALEEVY